MAAVYRPYEVNKKSLKLTKRAMIFNIERKSENRSGKITPFSIFNFK